jgi:hypothetical protein
VQVVFSLIIPVLGAISLLTALYFVYRAFSSRARSGTESYGFGQLEARHLMLVDFVRAGMALFLGLIFIAVFAVSPTMTGDAPEPAFTPMPLPTDTPDVATAVATSISIPTATVTPVPFPTSQVTVLPTLTNPPAETPTNTPEPQPETAVVTSPVGVYLRAEPSVTAADVEWLLEGTQLIILPGEAEADDYRWIFVRTLAGNEGWVAMDFIEINP